MDNEVPDEKEQTQVKKAQVHIQDKKFGRNFHLGWQ
jgi:hypothetical protein